MRTLRVGNLLGLLTLLVPAQVFAATIFWDGGGADTSWTTVGNWSGSTIPNFDDTAVFDATSTKNALVPSSRSGAGIDVRHGYTGTITTAANAVFTLNKLTIGASAATFRVGTDSTLVLNGSRTPLSGSGTYDASTNAGAITEFRGPGLTTVSGASVFPSLRLAPRSLGTGGTIFAAVHYPYNGAIDPDGGFAYFISDFPGYVTKVRLSDFTIQSTLDSVLNFPRSIAIDTTNGFLYVGDEAAPSKIAKIRLSDFTEIGTLTIQSSSGSSLRMAAIDTANGFLYFGTTVNTPAKIIKVRLSDFTYVSNLTLATGQVIGSSTTNASVIDGGYAYIGLNTSPGGIAKIRLSDFTQVDTLSFPAGEGGVWSISLDAASGYLYASTNDAPGKIVKVRLSDFSRIGSMTLNAGETAYSTGLYDGKLYLSIFTSPGKIGVVRLSDFTRTDTVTFSVDEDLPYPLVIDGVGGYLYAATLQHPLFRVVRVSLGTSDMRLGRSITTTSALTIGTGAALSLGSHVITATNATLRNYGTINEQTGRIVHGSSLTGPGALIIGDTITLSLTDSDENIDGTTRDTVAVAVGEESLTLTETTATSGVFHGSIPTVHATQTNGNGIIENDQNCVITVVSRFDDAQDSTDVSTANTTVAEPAVSCEQANGGGGRRDIQQLIDRALSEREARAGASHPSTVSAPSASPAVGGSSGMASPFRDVPVDSWFFPYVSDLAARKVVSGYTDSAGKPTGFFGPANPVTRAEVLKMAIEGSQQTAVGKPPRNASAKGTWAAPYVAWAEDHQLPTFSPQTNVHSPATRGEVVETIVRVFGLTIDKPPATYEDVPATHPYTHAIAAATFFGLVRGDTAPDGRALNRFRPDDAINRAEVAKIIALAVELGKQ